MGFFFVFFLIVLEMTHIFEEGIESDAGFKFLSEMINI